MRDISEELCSSVRSQGKKGGMMVLRMGMGLLFRARSRALPKRTMSEQLSLGFLVYVSDDGDVASKLEDNRWMRASLPESRAGAGNVVSVHDRKYRRR